MKTKDITVMAFFLSITIVLEKVLEVLPNVQLTAFLILLFTTLYSFKRSLLFIFLYVVLDILISGYFNPLFALSMYFGWIWIPVIYNFILHRKNNIFILAIFMLLFGFIYGWTYIPANIITNGINVLWPYILADLPYDIIMGLSSALSTLILFIPLYKTLNGMEIDA